MNLVFEGRLVDPSEAATAPQPAAGEITGRTRLPLASPPKDAAFPAQQLGAVAAYIESRRPPSRLIDWPA